MIVRAKSSLILVGFLLILLPVLAVLQYRWIGEVSAAERDRLESSLRAASNGFAADFDSEFFRLANAFQIRSGFPESSDPIAERYQTWSEMNPYPRLVRAIHLLKLTPDNGSEYYKVNPGAHALQPATLPKALENIRDHFRPGANNLPADDTVMLLTLILRPGRQPFGPARGSPNPRPLDEPRRRGDEPPPQPPRPLDRPDRGAGPDRRPGLGSALAPGGPAEGVTIIELDRDVILKELIPALAEKHFSTHDETVYRLAIVVPGDEPRVLYSSAGEWKPEDITERDAAINLMGAPRTGFVGRGRGGPRPVQGSIISEPWQLVVKHRAGSLENAVEQVRMRNLAISFGIILILGAGLITVVVSSQRAHTLGRLQMEFAAGVSHELRTPLAVIRSAAYNLRSGIVQDRESVEEYAAIVQEEARRLSEMVEEVLLYSETQSGQKKYKLETIDVNEVVDRAIAHLSPAIDFEQCELTSHIDQDLPPVKADAAALTQCVQNLLSNAFKYGKKGDKAQIEILARKEPGDFVGVSVVDHGPGIDSADQRQLFEAFYRGRNVGSNVPGNGLGLHLVKRIMQAQGGRVTFSPAPYGGASFTLHIPAAS